MNHDTNLFFRLPTSATYKREAKRSNIPNKLIGVLYIAFYTKLFSTTINGPL